MSAKSDPFVRVTCNCPICEREALNRYIKSKMFTPVETEDDQFVLRYRWELEQHSHLRPEYYHVWHCPHCHFCDEKEVFRGEDDLSGKLDILRDRLLIEARRPDGVFVRLGQLIDSQSDELSWSSALAAHILAIYTQNQLSTNMRLTGKLARLYLRTAWLYREQGHPEIFASAATPDPRLTQELQALQEEWEGGPFDETSALRQAMENYTRELDNAGRVDNVRLEISIMLQIVALHRRLGDKPKAYEYARMVFQQCTKKRGSVRQALEGAGRRNNVTERQLEQLRSLAQWLQNMLERAKGLADELAQSIFRDEYPRAREIVLAMESPTPEDILLRLRKEGFFEGTCRRVAVIYKKRLIEAELDDLADAESNAAKEAEEKRKNKGLFGRIAGLFSAEEEDG